MNLIFYSTCITTLDVNNSTTASEFFEIDLIRNLSNVVDEVLIISEQSTKNEIFKNIRILKINRKRKYYIGLKHNDEIMENISILGKETVILLYGYDLAALYEWKSISRKNGTKLVSFTFDTHKATIKNYPFFKKLLVGSYFTLGLLMLRHIDGILLLKDTAYSELKLSIPYLVTKIGIDESDISKYLYHRKNREKFRILYAGSLEEYNGIFEMINAFKNINYTHIFLDIYGTGTLKSFVEKESNLDPRITYFGSVSNDKINEVISNADLLLNLRDPDLQVCKFAFPSKLIKYMSSGVPVLSTEVIKDDGFDNSVFLIEKFSTENISNAIYKVINNPRLQTKYAINAKEFLKENYTWANIIPNIYIFFSHLF